jgi:hypothetical protein
VNGPGSKTRENYSYIPNNNSPYIPWMMFYILREDALPYLIDVSGIMAHMTQFIS